MGSQTHTAPFTPCCWTHPALCCSRQPLVSQGAAGRWWHLPGQSPCQRPAQPRPGTAPHAEGRHVPTAGNGTAGLDAVPHPSRRDSPCSPLRHPSPATHRPHLLSRALLLEEHAPVPLALPDGADAADAPPLVLAVQLQRAPVLRAQLAVGHLAPLRAQDPRLGVPRQLHHAAQGDVLLQLRAPVKAPAALGARVAPLSPGRRLLLLVPVVADAVLAEVVPTGQGHGDPEQLQADGAHQLLLQLLRDGRCHPALRRGSGKEAGERSRGNRNSAVQRRKRW